MRSRGSDRAARPRPACPTRAGIADTCCRRRSAGSATHCVRPQTSPTRQAPSQGLQRRMSRQNDVASFPSHHRALPTAPGSGSERRTMDGIRTAPAVGSSRIHRGVERCAEPAKRTPRARHLSRRDGYGTDPTMSVDGAGALEGMTSMPASSLAGLYETHVGRAVALATLLTGDRAIAEDIAHDAFLRVAGRFRDLRDPGAFGPVSPDDRREHVPGAGAPPRPRARPAAQPAPIGRGGARHGGRGSRRGVELHRGAAVPAASRDRPAVLGRPVRGRDRSGAAVFS